MCKCLLYKHTGLSSNPRTHIKLGVVAHICNPRVPRGSWEVETESLGTYWPASLVYTEGNIRENYLKHAFLYSYTNIQTYTEIEGLCLKGQALAGGESPEGLKQEFRAPREKTVLVENTARRRSS